MFENFRIIDFQLCKSDYNGFFIKELAILNYSKSDGMNVSVYLIEPPEDMILTRKDQYHNNYLERNIHGLNVYSGTVLYNNLSDLLKPNDGVYLTIVKGKEKRNFLKNHYKAGIILNWDDENSQPLNEDRDRMNVHCTYHDGKKNFSCAFKHCFIILNSMIAAKEELENSIKRETSM